MSKEITQELKFMPEETVILKAEKVGYGTPISTKSNDLILTNQAILLVRKNMLGKTKEVVRYPLADLRTAGGKPEVHKGGDEFNPTLDLYLDYGEEKFKFEWKKDIEEWIASITETVTGEKVERKPDFNLDDFKDIIGFAESVTGTVKDVKKAFGIKSNEQAVGKCVSCGASITGMEDESVQCPYCGTWNKL